ncbi:MAG: hypothetical protein GC189_08795 [Alphaproteobacteria bacterium]|nr:hypothetical protein [Alphaproteobacteria bacterium]
MNFNALARGAKLVALFCFFLPWATVSCSGNELANATGFQLMTGDIQPNPALSDTAQGQTGQLDADPNPYAIAAFALIALGLLASAFLRGKAAAGALLAASLMAMGASYYSVENLRAGMTREIARADEARGGEDSGGFLSRAQERRLSDAVAGAIRIEAREGVWATILALAAAALFAVLRLSWREPEVAPPAG